MNSRLAPLFVAALLLVGCSADLAALPTAASGAPQFETGVFLDDRSGRTTLGLWLHSPHAKERELLVSHGDATALGEAMVAENGSAVYFMAQHPNHVELHRFDLTTLTLATLFEHGDRLEFPPADKTRTNESATTTTGPRRTIVLPSDFEPPS